LLIKFKKKKGTKMFLFYKKMFKVVLIVAFFASPLLLKADELKREAINELLDITLSEKMFSDMVNVGVQSLFEQHPQMAKQEASIRKFFTKYMSDKYFREGTIEIYSDVFTTGEIKDLLSFYRTKTGQKSLEKLPEVTLRGMKLGREIFMQNMLELQKTLSDGMSDANVVGN